MIVYARHHYPLSVLDRIEATFHVEGASTQIRVANVIRNGEEYLAVLYKDGHQFSIISITAEDLIPPEPEKMIA